MSLTRAQRKAIRDAGPYYVERGYVLDNDGCTLNSYLSADVAAALNAIASEDPETTRWREALLRECLRPDGYSHDAVAVAGLAYRDAFRAAKRGRK